MKVGYNWSYANEKAKRRMKARAKAVTSGRFGASNRILQNYFPFDLTVLGYEVST